MGKCVRVEPKEGGSEKDLTENAIILKEHQERVRERLQKQDGLILDHGLGSGKTISAIAAAEDYGGAVVVTPAALRENFKKELRRYQAKGQYDVMSYEEFVRDRPNLVGRMLIVDEAHRLANSSTKRTQAIAEEASKASKRLLLTATPLQNRPSDASTLVNIAAGEKILPVGEADFRRKYLYRVGYVEGAFDNIFRGVPTYGSLKPKNLDEYRRKVSRYVDFYAPNQEGFPTVAKHTVNIPMSKAQARAQEAWLKEMPPDMKQRIKDGRPPESGDISRLNTFMNATRQTANTGGAYGATDEDLSPKVAAIADRIADSKGKALVYSNYIDSGVAPLEKALKQKGISSVRLTGGMSDRDRAQIVRDYNNDKFRTLIISSAGGEGLDLKKTEQIHVMEPHWNDEKINQVIGRGVRYKSHEGLPPDRQHVDVYKYVSVFPDEYFLFWNRYKGLKTADEYLSLMSERKLQLNQAFLNSYRRRSDTKGRSPAKCDPDHGWTQGIGKCVRKSSTSGSKENRRKNNSRSLPVAIIAGAALVGAAPAAYLAFRSRYRAGFATSAADAERISFEIENEMRREASARLGKPPSELSPEEIFMVIKPDKFDDKGNVLRETVYGVEKDKRSIAFTIGGFHDYGELGYGLANQVGGDLERHSIFPLTNKQLQISPEMTWLPMNEMLAQEVDPDGKGGFVKRGYLSRRGIDETMSRVFGEKEWARIRDEEVRKSSWYQETEPVVRQIVRYSSDLKMLFDNATQKHRNPDAVKAAAYAMAAKRLFPDKEIDFVAHSGGGIAAAEALEILKVKGIKARAAVVGTPHFGMTSLSREDLVTIAAKKPFQQEVRPKNLGEKIESGMPSDKMTILPMQNLVEMESPSIHNWVENPDGEDYKKGKRGYGQIPETYELIRAFLYGEESRKREEGSKRRKIQAKRQSQLRRQAFGSRNDSVRLDRRPRAKCDREAGWTQGVGKCVRIKSAPDSPAKQKSPSSAPIKVIATAAGLAGLSIGGYMAARERYRSQIPASAELALKRSLEIDPDTLPDFTGKEGILLAQPGFGGFLGKTQARGVEKIMERGFRDMAGDRYGTFMLPNEKFNVYMPDYVPEGWNPEDMRTYRMGPGGDAKVVLPAAKKMLRTALVEGKNPQSIEATAYLLAMERKFRLQNPDREPVIKAAGYSAGGMILSESNMQLKHLGKSNVEMLFLGAPYYGLTDETPNITRVGSRNDPAMKVVPHGNTKYFDEVEYHAHYQDYPTVRSFISDWLKKGTSGERKDSLYRGDRRPPAKCDPRRGWEQGAGKCVRVKPADEEPSSPRAFGRKMDITSDRAYHARLGRLGLLGGGVAVTAIVAGVGYQVASDVKKISVKPSEEEDLVDYDSFEPGDLIRKRTSMAGASVYHYAVYAGKDPETGEHKIIHTQAPDADYQNSASVIVRSSIRKKGTPSASPSSSASSSDFDDEGSAYMKVPTDEMYGKKGSKRLSREEILSRAEQAIGGDYTFHVFSSNCETFARGMVEGVSYSSQGDAVSPLTRFLGDTLAKVAASTTKKNYLSNKNRKTSTQLVEYFNSQSSQRKDSKGYQQKTVGLINVLAAARNENPARSLVDAYCDQVGIKRPDDYTKLVNELSRPLGTTKKAVQVKMYTDYAKMFFGTLRSQDILGKERSDSIRLDRRLAAKCDPRYGWKQGAGGKCVRARKPDVAMPRKGEALAASLGSYEINPDTGRPYKIRELRGIAREKGLVGYGSMTTGQMKSAMRLIDESPEDAQRKNLIKTFSRDRSISSKAIAAGLGNVKGNSPAGRRLIKEVKEANLTFKRFAALMKFASTSPAGWGVLGAAAFLGERTIAQWGKVKDDYRKGLDESAKIAASRVPNVNVRHPTPTNPKGQFFRPSASRATGKKTGSENITFVVSGAASGASRMIEDLRQLGKAPKATEAEKWMSRNNFVPIDLKETRVASADGGLDEAVQMMGDFMQNRKRGRNQDAVDLASSLFAHATAYPDKRVNLIAHGAGGLATKEALEILSRMEVKKGNRVIKGKDLVGKFNIVLLGTPHFGYTETVAQNTRTVTSPNDPFSRIPFSGGGMRPQWISSVKGHKPSDYLSDASVREAIRESFGYYRTDSASLEP